jgi:hypothetical protein
MHNSRRNSVRLVFPAALVWLVACGGAPKADDEPVRTGKRVFGKKGDDENGDGEPREKKPVEPLEREERRKLLAIDWEQVTLTSAADALMLWNEIAPTGADWEDKLDELPSKVERPLAFALIESGNFTCMPPVPKRDCVLPQFDVKEPAATAGFGDPCLRRLLALWALDKVEDSDLRRLQPALRAMVAIPPPESELVAAVLATVPEDNHGYRLDLLAHAWRAGQHDVAMGKDGVGKLDEAHLIEAVTKHHIDAALEILSAEGHRATYLAAVVDEQIGAKARTLAMHELVEKDPTKIEADVKAVLVKATAAKDCTVAATAARVLAQAGDKRFVPARPRAARTPQRLMRALCVLASYEQQQGADEPSLLATYVPKHGLERVTIAYDPLAEVDQDGDGDPHTERTVDLVPREQLAVPEVDDVVAAFRNCTRTTCKSADREVRFGFKPVGGQLLLAKIELVERPPCPKP